MLYALLGLVAMAVSAEAGGREPWFRPMKFWVTIQNANHHTLEHKYRCCWGQYRLKMLMSRGDFDWITIRTEPENNPHHHQATYETMYSVGVKEERYKYAGLTGFVVQYGRLQGERMVDDHPANGFWGIQTMWVNLNDNYDPKQSPTCKFTSKQEYGANKNVVVCLYERNQDDAKVLKKVQKAFPNATYFKSEVRNAVQSKWMSAAAGSAEESQAGMDGQEGMEGQEGVKGHAMGNPYSYVHNKYIMVWNSKKCDNATPPFITASTDGAYLIIELRQTERTTRQSKTQVLY